MEQKRYRRSDAAKYFWIGPKVYRITHILKEDHHHRKAGMPVSILGSKQDVKGRWLAMVCSEKLDFGSNSHQFVIEVEKLTRVG